MPDDSQSKPVSPTSHLTALEFVAHYLYRTKSVFEWGFLTLGIVQAEHSEADLENQIRTWEQVVAQDPTAEYAQHSIRSAQYNLEWVRFERSIYGDTFLHMAAAAVAASVISMAHQGIRLGERRGNASSDRMIQSPYRLREFVELSRTHGAHFWEKVSDAKPERLEFQKRVLNYDQKANDVRNGRRGLVDLVADDPGTHERRSCSVLVVRVLPLGHALAPMRAGCKVREAFGRDCLRRHQSS